jgi:hypothetical protein
MFELIKSLKTLNKETPYGATERSLLITTNYYWYHNKQFRKFKTSRTDDGILLFICAGIDRDFEKNRNKSLLQQPAYHLLHKRRALIVVYALPGGHVQRNHTLSHGHDLTTAFYFRIDPKRILVR